MSGVSVFCDNTVQEIFEDSVVLEENDRAAYLPKSTLFCCVSKITENLLLTSATAADPSNLQYFGVTLVINAAAELPDTPVDNNTNYCKISIYDLPSTDIISCFEPTLDLIHKEITSGGRVLVHCVAGISRSATICIAYLMKYHQLNLLQAYNHVKLKRSIIKPNCGFFRQLIEYEKITNGTCSVRMVYNDTVNMEIPDVYDCYYKNIITFRRKHRDIVRRH